MQPVTFGIVGIGGFGRSHLNSITELEGEGQLTLNAAVVRNPDKYADQVRDLSGRGVRILHSLEDLLREGGVDVIALPTGIQHHVPQTVACLQAGFDVVCEKPVAAVIQETDRMIAVKVETGRHVAIGYQAIPTPSIQTLKSTLLGGKPGKLRSIRVQAGWPRPDEYYTRNPWAGRLKVDGDWVLDSPINNAAAHQVNNALYLAGPSPDESAELVSVQAELYRARDIESLDTGCIRAITMDGVDIVIALSHVTRETFNPTIVCHCEEATIHWAHPSGETHVRYRDGTEESFDNEDINANVLPFQNMIDVLHGEGRILCTPENARAQTVCINGAHESSPGIVDVRGDFVDEEYREGSKGQKSRFAFIKGLDALTHRSFEEGKLFSELGAKWARPSSPFDVTGYAYFPGRKHP